jgi:eukaryotic-like serine/threonine-protein kinase
VREDDSLDTSFAFVLREVARAPSVSPETLTAGDDARSLVGGQFGPFRVVAWLGQGGMGCVYRAEDTRLGRMVALKLLPPGLAPDAAARAGLLREAKSAAAINHPRVATIYEVGEIEGVAFIAMEHVQGQTLRQRAAGRPLPPAIALGHALAVAEGLAAAHERGIVHRDLKPDNVMVGEGGVLKVLDFGLARPLPAAAESAEGPASAPREPGASVAGPPSLLRASRAAGTPGYMAPEQARGEPVDARADVYAFGILLAELLSGERPPRTTDPRGGRRPSAFASRPLRRLLERCLAAEPAGRYADGRALVEALRPLPELRTSGRRRALRLAAWAALASSLLALAGRSLLATGPAPKAQVQRRLTANSADNPVRALALSPEGRHLAYADKAGLTLLQLDTGERRPLALADCCRGVVVDSLSWFPGGEALLVGLKGASGQTRLWRLPLAGEASLVADGAFGDAALSPEGARVAFADEVGLAVRLLAGDERRLLAPFAEGDELKALAWSPDGTRLACVLRSGRGESERYTLETFEASGGRRVRLAEDGRLALDHDGAGVAWTPDGRIVYARAELPPNPPGANLWAITFDAKAGRAIEPARQLTHWSGFNSSRLSLGGRGLAFLRYETQVDIYAGALRPDGRDFEAPPRRLTPSDYNERVSGWTPDGTGLLGTSDERGTLGPFVLPLSGGARFFFEALPGERAAPKLDAGPEHRTWPQLSSDGNHLLYWRLPADAGRGPAAPILMRVGVDGGTPSPLVAMQKSAPTFVLGSPPPHAQRFRCARAAARCVISEDDGPWVAFSTFDPGASGPPKPALRLEVAGDTGHYGWSLSPDGSHIALPLRTGLAVYPLDGGPPRLHALRPECGPRHVDWGASDDLFFLTAKCSGDAEPYQLWALRPGEPPHTLWQSGHAFLSNVSVSPDGRHLAFSAKPYDNDVWLLEGL